jgi:hypothetical protein
VANILNARLLNEGYGGLDHGASIPLIGREVVTRILRDEYLSLPATRIDGWETLLTTVE